MLNMLISYFNIFSSREIHKVGTYEGGGVKNKKFQVLIKTSRKTIKNLSKNISSKPVLIFGVNKENNYRYMKYLPYVYTNIYYA